MKPKSPAAELLGQMQLAAARAKFPGNPYLDHHSKVKVNGANSLTQAVIRFISLKNGQAERISTSGRVIDESRVVENVLGQKMRIGSSRYIPGTGVKGSADISAIIRTNSGKVIPWRIEIKWAKDRLSDAQVKYSESVIKAGGWYSVVRTLDDFVNQYNLLVNDEIT